MGSEIGVTQLISVIVPVLISGIIAIVTAVVGADFHRQIFDLKVRVAVLEQLLIDNKIPLPPNPPAGQGQGAT